MMNRSAVSDFLSGFDETYYPKAFTEKYELLECLSSGQAGETLLVRDVFHNCFIAKCYTESSLLSRSTETELLASLHHEGLPAFVEEFRSESMVCVVRRYANGVPLNRLQTRPTERQTVSIGLQLCGILGYLHRRTPPVIHRDIKPQNVILGEDGTVTLIDFGISRRYDASARTDTVFFGTQEFAPPEQYGFAQTDCRADIYSLGVLLGWLLTGRTRDFPIRNRRLRRIVRKCTAFDPQNRYRDADSVRRALENADGRRLRRAAKATCAAAALALALTAGFAAGRFTDFRPALFYPGGGTVSFADPLIEQAVRLQLDKASGDPVRREELEQVRELYVYRGQATKTWDEYNTLREAIDAGSGETESLAVSTLDDLAELKNLRKLSVGYGSFTDLSAVAELTGLRMLEFYDCPFEDISAVEALPDLQHFSLNGCGEVTDLSPLAGCVNIDELVLSGCDANDYSFLAQMGDFAYLQLPGVELSRCLPYLAGKTIRQLRLGYVPLSSMDDLAQIDGLIDLMLVQMQPASLAGIERLTDLTRLTLTDMPGLDLTPLLSLPNLMSVTLSEDMRGAAGALAENELEITYQ